MFTSCQLREFLGVFLLILVIYLGYLYYQARRGAEHYTSYDENVEKQTADAEGLTKTQKTEVEAIYDDMIPGSISEYVTANKTFLKGPVGPAGPQGSSGGTYIDMGYLVNQASSYGSVDSSFSDPDFVLTRASGTDPKSAFAFIHDFAPFMTYEKWMLNSSNQLMNAYDQTCMAFDPKVGDEEKVYMTDCMDTSVLKLQRDKFNRFVIQGTQGANQKCLIVGNTEKDIVTAGLPDCLGGEECYKVGFGKRFLKVDDCDKDIAQEDEVFAFL
jgi:hypothetical protein